MRFFVMLLLAGAVVYGILQFKGRLENMYSKQVDKTAQVEQATGEVGQREQPRQANPSRARELLRVPRPELAVDVVASRAFSAECKPFVTEVQKLDLIEFEKSNYSLSYQQLPRIDEKCSFDDAAVKSTQAKMLQVCKPASGQSEKISEECASALFMLRAALTRQMYANKPLSAISDLRVLTDLMFGEFATFSNQDRPDVARAKAVAERMLELNPRLYVAAKVGAFSEVIEVLSNQARNPTAMSESEWFAASGAISRAKQLNPNDPALEDADLAVKTKGFQPELSLQHSRTLILVNSENAKAWYLKAFAEWKLGDRNASKESLKRAISLSPERTDWKKILVAISRPDATEGAFSSMLTFGIGSRDFEN